MTAYLPTVIYAQTPASPQSSLTTVASGSTVATPVTTSAVGGTNAFDMLSVSGTSPSNALRYGNVIPGSEQVMLDGSVLAAGRDYSMDNAAGVVYLMCPSKSGQTLSVTYRHDSKAPPATTGDPFMGVAGLHYGLSPGLNMMMGMGVAERAADGTVLTSNNLGWNNNFALGSGKVNGLFIMGDRQKQQNVAGMNMSQDDKPGSASNIAGNTKFLVQNFRSGLLGGSVNFDYQDISKNFSGFSQAKAAGYDDATVNKFTAERGFQRMGYSLDSVKFDGLNLSNGYRSVQDGSSKIDWQSFAVAQGGLKLGYTSRKIDNSFSRFNDLSETDKAQLQKEVGMSRQDLAGSFEQKTQKFSFDSFSIKDDTSEKTIDKQDFKLDTGTNKFEFGDQSVDSGFSRFSSLLQPEQGAYGREAGMHRQWLALDSAVMGKGSTLSFHEDVLNSATANFRDNLEGYQTKTWSIQRVDESAAAGFTNFAAMQDAETDAHIKQIAAFYDPTIKTGVGDRAGFAAGNGIERTFTSFAAQPYKNWNVSFTQLNIQGDDAPAAKDGVAIDTASLKSKNVQINYRHEGYSQDFNQATQLMGFEQQHIGTIAGLDRTDLTGTIGLTAKKTLTFSQLNSDDPSGDANRALAHYVDPKIDVQVASRSVSNGFQGTGTFADAESSMLNTLQGYKEQDAHIKWQILPNMKLDSSGSEVRNLGTGQLGEYDTTQFDWTPSKATQLSYLHQGGQNSDPFNAQLDSLTQRIDIKENFGKMGSVEAYDLTQKYDIPGSTTPDDHTSYLSYTTKLTKNTQVKTEQIFTEYSNGTHQDVDANTLSTQLSKRAGVTVSQSNITGDTQSQQDEIKRNYGFWYDVGKGLRISYGYNRDLNQPTNSTLNSVVAVGTNADQLQPGQVATAKQGAVGNVLVGGGYGVNSWDGSSGKAQRTQSFSNVALDSAKPIRFGPFQDVKFKFGLDAASDYAAWLRDNQVGSLSGRLGTNQFGFDYKSQIQTNGDQGVDRGFHLITDQSPKKLLNVSVSYKLRTLPGDQTYAIRDFNVTARPTRTLAVTNQLQTNPEVVRTDLILGSLPQAARSNKWKLDYLTDKRLTLGTSWEELRNDSNSSVARTGGINAKLFANSVSPLTLFYGLEQSDSPTTTRKTAQRYSLQFDRAMGATQSISLFIGNLSYDNSVIAGQLHNNWTIRSNYQFRFW